MCLGSTRLAFWDRALAFLVVGRRRWILRLLAMSPAWYTFVFFPLRDAPFMTFKI